MADSQKSSLAINFSGMLTPLVRACGQGGALASVGLYLAPMPTIQQIMQTGAVGSMPLLPYSSMLSNAFLWTTYGLLKREPKIWSCNVIGVFLGAYYCVNFVKNLPKHKNASVFDVSTPTLPGSVRQHFQGVMAVIFGILLLAFAKPFANTTNLIGNIGVIICMVMFASPLSVIKVVLETKSAKSIPLPFTLISCLNCFMWSMFGWFEMKDINVYLPNLMGLMSGLVQVALKIIFGDNDNLPAYTATDIAP